ncbi:MAG TPA: GFA family protein [Alphaproteobacteria bacterium]|nr:GFA family protein [Alphaproteobacteria bacterium]
MQAMTITGGCLCGTVRYEARTALTDVHYCHCRLCQKAFGNLFAVFGSLPAAALRFTAGAPKLYRSSPYAERGFCAECGTPLTFRYLSSTWIAVSIGSLDRPELVRPEIHRGIESQVPWLTIDDNLPRKAIEGDPEYLAMRRPSGP